MGKVKRKSEKDKLENWVMRERKRKGLTQQEEQWREVTKQLTEKELKMQQTQKQNIYRAKVYHYNQLYKPFNLNLFCVSMIIKQNNAQKTSKKLKLNFKK